MISSRTAKHSKGLQTLTAMVEILQTSHLRRTNLLKPVIKNHVTPQTATTRPPRARIRRTHHNRRCLRSTAMAIIHLLPSLTHRIPNSLPTQSPNPPPRRHRPHTGRRRSASQGLWLRQRRIQRLLQQDSGPGSTHGLERRNAQVCIRPQPNWHVAFWWCTQSPHRYLCGEVVGDP